MYRFLFLSVLLFSGCAKEPNSIPIISIDNPKALNVVMDSADIREFRVLDSRYLNNADIWKDLNSDLADFSEEHYQNLKPLIIESDIPALQHHVASGNLSYETLVKFYLYRIRKYDRETELSLNSVISINPFIIDQDREKDKESKKTNEKHIIFGMPILLKDNINAADMPTTAGAVALYNNYAEDAFITSRLKEAGALILGKANLSEWAYFFCGDCPSGYSAIGGQTLNPYGRRIMGTGGSSSGSGVSVAANFAVAAIGSETSGSILSPSSANSIVGLKPTIGLLGRSGIVPISSTLDTPGPMTKNVIDNAILLSVLAFEDSSDKKTINLAPYETIDYAKNLTKGNLDGKRYGIFKRLMQDSVYAQAISDIKNLGAEVVEVDEVETDRSAFLRLLNLEMKNDLPHYLKTAADTAVVVSSIKSIIDFNNQDSLNRSPYGQRLFKGIVDDKGTQSYLDSIKTNLKNVSKNYFDVPTEAHDLDGFLSINNWHANLAALAEFPAITVPMGYTLEGRPRGLTFISQPLSERQLLEWAYKYEQATKKRIPPVNYN